MFKRVAIIASDRDPASLNILRNLMALIDLEVNLGEVKSGKIFTYGNIDFFLFGEELIYMEDLDLKLKNYDLFVFLSRHESASRMRTLSAHVPGNWTGDAKYGGRPRSLCVAPANFLTKLVITLKDLQRRDKYLENWNVVFEVTHHGPFVQRTPTAFVEIGSERSAWCDEKAGLIVAEAVLSSLKSLEVRKAAVALGGPHYAPGVNRVILEEFLDIAVGHIAPEYVFDDISKEEILMAIERTFEEVTVALVDRKGLKKRHKKWLLPLLDELGLEIIKI
ncbi:MAG: hypothetical protein DRJ51_03560 [Thermoprotei archaeon]|nr:MAG: hypothetical protein DRJ36_04540 [Thermoprotei archaeon]RLE81555.1 MAG: hypothetical protein DRJ51_03560 [Thermoprotei archaeon]